MIRTAIRKRWRMLPEQPDRPEFSYLNSCRTAGVMEGKRAVALNLLQSGLLDIEKIAEMTGLTVEEVQGVKADQEDIYE